MISYGESINRPLLEFIGQLQGTVLDVGCGRGRWANELRQLGASQLIGLEPTDDARTAADHYDVVIQSTIEEADLPTADVVIAADVLEHICDPWTALSILRRSVAPDGELIVSVPNIQYIKALITIGRGRFPRDEAGGFWDRTHVQWFTAASLAETLANAGWSLDRVLCDVGVGRRATTNLLTLNLFRPFLAHQLFARARAEEQMMPSIP